MDPIFKKFIFSLLGNILFKGTLVPSSSPPLISKEIRAALVELFWEDYSKAEHGLKYYFDLVTSVSDYQIQARA